MVRILATFNGLFGNFLNFVIPLIIIGFVAPGIGDLGTDAGKLLAITEVLLMALLFFLVLGLFYSFYSIAYFLKVGSLNVGAANPEEVPFKLILR